MFALLAIFTMPTLAQDIPTVEVGGDISIARLMCREEVPA